MALSPVRDGSSLLAGSRSGGSKSIGGPIITLLIVLFIRIHYLQSASASPLLQVGAAETDQTRAAAGAKLPDAPGAASSHGAKSELPLLPGGGETPTAAGARSKGSSIGASGERAMRADLVKKVVKKIGAKKIKKKVKKRFLSNRRMVQAAHILVGGGTGFIGRHLVNCLKRQGAKVKIITRKAAGQPDHISWDKIKSDGLPKETTAVVNLSGRNILELRPWAESYKKEVYSSRIETNRLLVDAIHSSQNKPNAFVTVSGVGYYEPSDSKEYDENWKQPENCKTDNYLMNLAREWEESSELNEQLAPSTRRVVIRSGVVIGPGGGIIKETKTPYSFGVGGPLGDGNQWFPWIHLHDVANMFKFSITNAHVTGIINGVAPEQVKNKDFAEAMGNALNRPYFARMPAFMVNLLFHKERAVILLKGQKVKSRAGLLGFRFEHNTLHEAIRKSI